MYDNGGGAGVDRAVDGLHHFVLRHITVPVEVVSALVDVIPWGRGIRVDSEKCGAMEQLVFWRWGACVENGAHGGSATVPIMTPRREMCEMDEPLRHEELTHRESRLLTKLQPSKG